MDSSSHSEDEDSIQDDFPPPPQLVATTRLSKDKTLFDSWLRDQREDTYRSLCSSNTCNGRTLPSADGLEAEDATIISSPREYQTELFERAKEKNIIAVLDTGVYDQPLYLVSSIR
jgi:endoribonuclease Dicer